MIPVGKMIMLRRKGQRPMGKGYGIMGAPIKERRRNGIVTLTTSPGRMTRMTTLIRRARWRSGMMTDG